MRRCCLWLYDRLSVAPCGVSCRSGVSIIELLQNKPVATEPHRRTQNGDLRAGSRDFSVDFCVFLWLNPRQRYSATSLMVSCANVQA
jgi:hypothetical protein